MPRRGRAAVRQIDNLTLVGPVDRGMRLFDVYRGEGIPEGRKSVAFHAEFRSPDRTLSDEDARGLREKIVAALGAQFAAELRG